MRCLACDKALSDFEATRKSETTGEYLDLCNHCYGTIADDINVDERMDLSDTSEESCDLEGDYED